jgi:hypothetical protein
MTFPVATAARVTTPAARRSHAARTPRSASSSRAAGTPKIATTRSFTDSSTLPPCASTVAVASARARRSSSRRASGSCVSVPRSASSTVTVFRLSSIAGALVTGADAGASSAGSCRRTARCSSCSSCTGLEAELVDERRARVRVRLECVALSPRSVKGEDELAPAALAERLLDDECLQLGHELGVTTERELGIEPAFERVEPESLETDGRRDHRLVGQVGERRPAPERKCIAQQSCGLARLARSGFLDEPAKAFEIELVPLDAHEVPRRARHDPLAELAPQPQDVVLQRRERSGRRLVSPDAVDQPLGRDDLVRVEQEQREHRTPLRASERHAPLAVEHLERTEDPELHGGHATTRIGPRFPRAPPAPLRPCGGRCRSSPS